MTEIERLREALLPCPFCGGVASFEAVETRWTVGCNETNEDSEGGVFEILCYGYQSLTTFATKREAIAAWNRRAALAATPPGAERWKTGGEYPQVAILTRHVETRRYNWAADEKIHYASGVVLIEQEEWKVAPPSSTAGEK